MKTIENGLYIQIYRDAIRGTPTIKQKKLLQQLDILSQYKIVKGIAWHGFVGDLSVEKFNELTKYCKERNLKSLAAYGLGSKEPEKYGKWIGEVANQPDCYSVIFDMESAWESDDKKKTPVLLAKAKKMGEVFRSISPNSLAIDQPWPVPTYHWSFPWEETAEFIDIRAPQYYVNNWIRQYGKEAYEKCWAWFEQSWKKLNERLAKKNLVKPMIYTIQGYKWNLTDLIHCLCSNPTLIVWSDPFPDEVFMLGLEIVNKLFSMGFTGPDAVRKFQEHWNMNNPKDKITVDNLFGKETAKRLGVRFIE